jgi:thiamine-monophosphate kinase
VASELSLIQRFIRPFGCPPSPRGPGDDAAVYRGRAPLCLTTDAVVEDVHFSFPAFSLADVGHKALAVNLSDLAAMGSKPAWFLCALGLPSSLGAGEVSALASGMARLAGASGIQLLGGNVTRADKLTVTLTVAGTLSRAPLLRTGAKVGDALYISGTLGDARLGLQWLISAPGSGPALRQKRPSPRIALGLLAARFAHAAMDVSDGLAQDLGRLCQASSVGARVELESLPLSRSVRAVFSSRREACAFAAAGGEDYELMLAVPRSRQRAFERACLDVGERVTQVGVVVRGRRLSLVDSEGRILAPPAGFDHFDDVPN